MKVRNGPEPPTLVIERDKELFVSQVVEDNSQCPPARIKEILHKYGGNIDGQGTFIEAIIKEIGCSERTAQKYITEAVKAKAIKEGTSPAHHQKKMYHVGLF